MQLNDYQLREIYEGCSCDIDFSLYSDPKFSARQMYIIRCALMEGLEIDHLAKPELDVNQMNQIYLGLVQCVDVSLYANEQYTWRRMQYIRRALVNSYDILPLINPAFDDLQLWRIFNGLNNGISMRWAKPNMPWEYINLIAVSKYTGIAIPRGDSLCY